MKIKTFFLLLSVVFAFTHISYAGEKFTKISAFGEELPDTASEWSCVKNNITGQIWEVKTIANMGKLYNFSNVWDYKRQINKTGLCGYADWRIPTVKELNSILDRSRTNPAIDTQYFPYTQSTNPMSSAPGYWTSTPKIDTRLYIQESWGVNFWNGATMNFNREFYLFVRLVRGDKYFDFFDYSKLDTSGNLLAANNSSHSCVHDNHSGLIWEVKTIANKDNEYTFDETSAYIQQINQSNFCGHSDWRLPTVDDLITLVDYSISSPSIKTKYFPHNSSKGYWASSSSSSDNYNSWAVYGNGVVMPTLESFNFNVRLVRTTQPKCIVIDSNLNLEIPCADFNGTQYSFSLNYINALNWELDVNSLKVVTGKNNCLSFDNNLNLEIPCADFNRTKYGFKLQYFNSLIWNLDLESFTEIIE